EPHREQHSFPTRRSSDLVRLAEGALPGASPEGVALSDDEKTLYVANAHSNAVALVALSEKASGAKATGKTAEAAKSKILGFIPRSEEHTSELQSPCNLVC